MTQKDYRRLADALLSARNASTSAEILRGVDNAVIYIADALAQERWQFDRQRFYTASGFHK